jgi:ComF family protein
MPLSAEATPAAVCGACLNAPPPYRKARFGVVHVGNVRRALIGFKYYGQIHRRAALARILTETFDHYFNADNADVIIPMPMHPRRLIQRGFNQVVLLGESLTRHSGIPLYRNTLTKIIDTLPQVGLPRAQRVKNIKGSFGTNGNERIRGKRVLLVDDVSTTGSTISEASKTLMHSGANSIDVIVLALRTRNVIIENVSGKEQSDGIDDTGGL